MVTPFPDKKETGNLNFVDISEVIAMLEIIDLKDYENFDIRMVIEMGRKMSTTIAANPDVRNVLINTQFDAVITEWFFSDIEAGYAAVQQVPWIVLNSAPLTPHFENLVDTVRSIPTVPVMLNDASVPMSFWERVKNTLFYSLMSIDTAKRFSISESDYEMLFKPIAEYRGVSLPTYYEALHNISILFVNGHPAYEPVKSMPPNVVDIAGYHISEALPALPKDLQELLDSAKNGVIYFSMGTAFKSTMFPNQTKAELVKLFGKLPYTVLWKFEEQLENLPNNLHIKPWMPQSAILAHPNLKVFITHGGLLSKLESLHHGVPTVNVPVFGDQPSNAAQSERAGHALKVELNDNLAANVEEALRKIMDDDSYYNKAKYLSGLFRNRLVPPSKLIQYYTEIAIKTKGAYHLRSPALMYKWYQLWMLDQLVFFMFIVYIIYKIIKKDMCSEECVFENK
ncbi:UDP-glucosyltransferase 2-like [Aricia agestis]|uniref:UDP-glucosyltransferase 2-like n=1 Tax=Aricia agestis TaxID=91739 RepID=UPI001C206DEC|nr:UDP-glucosyltransferase 2-like [Aricia agestis]